MIINGRIKGMKKDGSMAGGAEAANKWMTQTIEKIRSVPDARSGEEMCFTKIWKVVVKGCVWHLPLCDACDGFKTRTVSVHKLRK